MEPGYIRTSLVTKRVGSGDETIYVPGAISEKQQFCGWCLMVVVVW